MVHRHRVQLWGHKRDNVREVSVNHAHPSHEDPCIPGQEACHGSHGENLNVPAATWKIGQHGHIPAVPNLPPCRLGQEASFEFKTNLSNIVLGQPWLQSKALFQKKNKKNGGWRVGAVNNMLVT